jgi:hypothetical protein
MPRPAAAPIRFSIARRGDDVLIDPWPFDQPQIELKIPVCRIAAKPFSNNDELRAIVPCGGSEILTCMVMPGKED